MTEALKIMIVDDEPLARELLETYLKKLPGTQIAASCSNALEAFGVLSRQPIDLALLDINMPEISGTDLLRTLKHPPKVIFTTAYTEFAVESYELNAVDYLLKPITFDRFVKAIHKATELIRSEQAGNIAATIAPRQVAKEEDILFVKSEGKMIRIDMRQVWFIEGLKNYIRIWTEQGKVVVHSTMKHLEEQLAGRPLFIRVSKSYIINLEYVAEVDGNMLRIKGEIVTIGNTYRDEINKVFERYRLL